jgi:hypothetical protein
LTSDKPYNKSWQAAICFYNNIWQVPAPIRVLAATQSVTQIYILARRDRLINFSTYSVSLKHIEDMAIGILMLSQKIIDCSLNPILPKVAILKWSQSSYRFTLMLPNQPVFWSSMRNQYEQIKRWAWGCE